MYPRFAENPLCEEQILQDELEPTNEGYAVAKVAKVARLAGYLSVQHGVEYKTYIPCNLYGYWDKFDPQKSHMIPAVIRKLDDAIKAQAGIVDILRDGTARREFMFAEGLADFILFSLSKFGQVPSNINVGIGHDYSINDYYSAIAIAIAIAIAVGFSGVFELDLSKSAGMKQKLVDISKQSLLGWSLNTSLETGIRKTYAFYLNEVL